MPNRARVGIDGGSWGNARGYGRFTRELVRALAGDARHSYSLFLDQHTPDDQVPDGVEVIRVPTRVPASVGASASGFRSPADMLRMSRAMRRASLDVLFFPSVYTFVPVLRRTPTLVGIHDVIAERYPGLVFSSARARLFWRAKVALALRQASLVLTVSAHARDGIVRMLGVPPARIRVTSEAPSSPFRLPVAGVARGDVFGRFGFPAGAPVVMYVGGIAPHKNLDRLVRVFGQVTAEPHLAHARLLIVGDFAADTFLSAFPDLERTVRRHYSDRIVFAGRVEDDALSGMLGAARALALVSIDEGFGLPGVEAAACGAAVIATRQSGLPEILGDAALIVDPLSDVDIGEALRRTILDAGFARALGARGAARVQGLSWRRSAADVADVFDELAGGIARP